jgi:hypothetical protein
MYQAGRLGPHAAAETAVTIDLSSAVIDEVINPENLTLQTSIAATPATREILRRVCEEALPEKVLVSHAISS